MKKQTKAKKSTTKNHPYQIGKSYLFRCVTMYQVGTVKAVYDNEIVLEPAAWIADTGRFSAALRDGALSEVEPCQGPAIVGRGAIVDAWEWKHAVPHEAK